MHVITGTIRKAPFTRTGTSAKGEWQLFAVELSESWKDKDGNRQYTNFRASLFASTPGSINYNKEVLVEGAVVSVSSETLQVVSREHNGKTYTHLEMINPKLVFAKAPEVEAPQQQSTSHNGRGAAQQPKPQQQNSAQQSSNEPPMDFSDDIPFAPVGLQYARHAIYSI